MVEHLLNGKRYFSVLSLLFILGIYLTQATSFEDIFINIEFLTFLISALFAVFIFCVFKYTTSEKISTLFISDRNPLFYLIKYTAFTISAIIFLSAGCIRMSYIKNDIDKKAEMFAEQNYFVRMMVKSEPHLNSQKTAVSFDGRVISYIKDGTVIDVDETDIGICMYSSYIGALKLEVGNVVEFYGNFSFPKESETYGDFDYNLYLRQKESTLIGYCKFLRLSNEEYQHNLRDKFLILGLVLKRNICDTIDADFSYSDEHSSLMKSIMTGDKNSMPDSLKDAMSKSGISHIAAVSGMHVSVLFSAVTAIFGLIRFRKELIFLITIPILFIFMTVASFSPSVMRAVIMLIVYIIAYLIERDHDPITALFIAAFAILLYNPYNLFSVSFLLSFGSSLAILIFSPYLIEELGFLNKIPFIGAFAVNSFAVSIASFLGTVYFSLYFFNYIALSGIIVNLWIIPLVPIVFCAGYGVWIMKFISPILATSCLRYFAVLPLEIIIRTAYLFDNVSFLTPYMQVPNKVQFAAYILLLIFIFKTLTYRKKRRDLVVYNKFDGFGV